MSIFDIVRRVRQHLEEHGRLPCAMLRREFSLDDDTLDAIVEELVDVQEVARRDATMLRWTGSSGPAPPAAVPSAPVRPIAAGHIADKIRQAKPSIEGERKHVTVLFADVKGSMDLAEPLDPEEWSRIVQRFFTILADGVERFEGFVHKFTGDGIMALFGAPIAHEDRARSLAKEAIEIAARKQQAVVEARAQLALARGLGAVDGADAATEVGTALDRARALVQTTGARSYAPQILLEPARSRRCAPTPREHSSGCVRRTVSSRRWARPDTPSD